MHDVSRSPKSLYNSECLFQPADMKWLEGEIKALEVKCMTTEEEKLNIAPKTPNWDLKRDMKEKFDKLNRLTKKAIAEILQKRKEAEESSEDDDDDDDDEDEDDDEDDE
mmetsp:Transcript_9994/g.19189  ORF Transcript_9994/g.19189 Transcript_9994/m.19189 type:complete len:109 (+) Transcript_9994:314-640(+)